MSHEESQTVTPCGRLSGTLRVPGDKSVGHRALMFAALCEGVTEVENLPDGEDNHSTRAVLRALGVHIEEPSPGVARVTGRGAQGLLTPSAPLDCGNSGTTMRLMTGLLAGQGIEATLIGDESLTRRPMARVTQPLSLMGFEVEAEGEGERPPIRVAGTAHVPGGMQYESPVASAQVKSALLLASLRCNEDIVVSEPGPSRDHTERLLRYLGFRVEGSGNYHRPDGQGAYVRLYSPKGRVPKARPVVVPGDISSAAFFLVAAALVPDSDLTLKAVSINPTRTGIVDALERFGVRVNVTNRQVVAGNEPVADMVVAGGAALHGAILEGDLVPRAIDELPVLAVLAAAADGETVIRDAAELRVKESDRIESTARLLRALGAEVEERADGMRVVGPTAFKAFTFDAGGDHRLAMAAAVAALVADGPCEIQGAGACAVSYPGFFDDLASLTGAEK